MVSAAAEFIFFELVLRILCRVHWSLKHIHLRDDAVVDYTHSWHDTLRHFMDVVFACGELRKKYFVHLCIQIKRLVSFCRSSVILILIKCDSRLVGYFWDTINKPTRNILITLNSPAAEEDFSYAMCTWCLFSSDLNQLDPKLCDLKENATVF